MEALSALAGNGIWSLGTILVVIIILLFAVKKGWIGGNIKGVRIGQSEEETRALIRNQWEYACSACDAQFYKIRRYCKSDEHCKYLVAKVTDIFQQIAVYNHVSMDDSYIKAKQGLVLQAIRKRADDSHFWSSDFEECCNKFVKETIRVMYEMKSNAHYS